MSPWLPLLVTWASLGVSPVKIVDRVGVTEAVLASDGTVWARRADGRLSWFEGGAWKPAPEHSGATVEALAAEVKGGGVVSLWNKGATWELWRSWKVEQGRVGVYPLPLPPKPRLFAASDGSVWLLGESRRLIQLRADGSVGVHVLEPAWLVMPEHKKPPSCDGLTANGCCESSSREQIYCGAVHAFEAEGAVWFWSKGSSNSWVLPGMLSLRGGAFTPWTAPGLPSAVTQAVLPRGSSALLSASGEVFRVDLRAGTVAKEPFPPLKEQTPQDVLAFFQSADATWALVSRAFQQLEGKLFRRGATGSFEVALEGVGGLVYPFLEPPSFVSAKRAGGREHVWLATRGGAPWHFGESGPERVDWSRGLPFGNISGLFRLGADELLITDVDSGTAIASFWGGAAGSPELVKRFPVMKRALAWTADSRLWWLEEKDPLRIHEWNGEAARDHGGDWVEAPLSSDSTLFVDSAQTLWVVPTHGRGFPGEGPPVLRFDTGRESATVHASYLEAVRARGAVSSVSGWEVDSLPVVLADGTFCHANPHRNLSCVDAKGAHTAWSAQQISLLPGADFWASATAGPGGALTVVINHHGKNVQWVKDDGTWRPMGEAPSPPNPSVALPAHCPATTSAVEGLDGRRWYSSAEGLMVNRGSVCRSRSEGVSFPAIAHARFDAKGHDALIGGGELMVLMDDTAFPDTKLGPPVVRLDTVRIPVSGAGGVAEASVDGGPWITAELDAKGTLLIEGLRRGEHRLRVRAASEHLRVDPTPVEVVVRVAWPDAALLETLLAEVVQPEAKRERLLPRFRLVAGLAVPKLLELRAQPRAASSAGLIDQLVEDLK